MEKDFANKLDDAAEGIVEFVVRLLRTAYYAVFKWKLLIAEQSREPRTRVVGPRVFLVASVLVIGIVGEMDGNFWDAETDKKLEALGNYLASLADVSLVGALVQSAPFFVVALLASVAVRSFDPEHRPLRDIIHYAMAGISLVFFPTLFVATLVLSRLLEDTPVLLALTVAFIALIPIGLYVARLRYSAAYVQKTTPSDSSPSFSNSRLLTTYVLVLIATCVVIIAIRLVQSSG